MTTYEIRITDAMEKAMARLEALAWKAERKGDLARAQELRRRVEVLRAER